MEKNETTSFDKKIDERDPKDIFKKEMYLTIPMVRRILNCSYGYARNLVNELREIDRQNNIFVVDGKPLKVRTASFKQFLKTGN